jgi:hypothetical protein
MGHNLLTIQKFSDQPKDGGEYPNFSDGWQLKLADGERIVWQGTASALRGSRMEHNIWKTTAALNARTTVFITDKRLVYICRKYKQGAMWFGGPLAIVLTLGGKGIAILQRQGKAAVGQVRFDAPYGILAKGIKLGPVTSNEVTLVCVDDSGMFQLKLDLSNRDYEIVAATLAQQVATYRGVALPKAESKHESRTTLIGYTFPRG